MYYNQYNTATIRRVRQYAKTAGALPKIMSYDIILQSTVTK